MLRYIWRADAPPWASQTQESGQELLFSNSDQSRQVPAPPQMDIEESYRHEAVVYLDDAGKRFMRYRRRHDGSRVTRLLKASNEVEARREAAGILGVKVREIQ